MGVAPTHAPVPRVAAAHRLLVTPRASTAGGSSALTPGGVCGAEFSRRLGNSRDPKARDRRPLGLLPRLDPGTGPIVRIQAGRLRRALERYYLVAGIPCRGMKSDELVDEFMDGLRRAGLSLEGC